MTYRNVSSNTMRVNLRIQRSFYHMNLYITKHAEMNMMLTHEKNI